jgi:transcriptional regulator with XRE-family HTH domain/tetratricopeptide (TPR) repeat protein
MQKACRTGGIRAVSGSIPLAERLRSLRTSAGHTLESLAALSGVSARTISDIERGISLAPHRRTVDELARGLGLAGSARDDFVRSARVRRRVSENPPRTSASTPHRVADFTGREREIAQITSALGTPDSATVSASIVVISGAPGLGKTTSAIEALGGVQHTWPTMLFVDLDGLSPDPLTPLEIIRELLRQLPTLGEMVPQSFDDAVRLWRVATADDPPAVLLDNAASESQIRPVLAMDPRGAVVVTSRRSLAGLEGAARVVFGPLDGDDSRLLLERLIPAGQRAHADLPLLAALCDNVPLALRIAGNRIASRPSWTAADFVKRMRSAENRLRLLVAGDLAVETAFALSYDDLDPQTALLFGALSVVDGASFDARIAAATLGADVLQTETRLDELTDLGLLEARGGNRYRLHDLLRLFAATRLRDDHGQAAVVACRDRLRHWLLGSLERAGSWFETARTPGETAGPGISFPDAATATAWIRLEEPHWWPAMRSAAAAGEHDVVVDVADSLHWFSELWTDRGRWTEFFTLAVESARALGDPRLEAMQLGYVVWSVIIESGDMERALEVSRRAVRAAEAAEDHEQLGWSHFYAAWSLLRLSRLDECAAEARESIAEFGLAGEEEGAFQSMIALGRVHTARGDHELAIRDLTEVIGRAGEAVDQARSIVPLTTVALASQDISVSYLALDRKAEAMAAAGTAVSAARRLNSSTRLSSALRQRAIAHLALGEKPAAGVDVSEALSLLDSHSKDAFLVELRTQLEEIRAMLMRGSDNPA